MKHEDIDHTGLTGIGGGDDPVADIFGAPDTAFEFASSSLTGLTTFGTPDILDADTTIPDHLYIEDKNGSWQFCGVYAAVTAPCTIITRVADDALRGAAGSTFPWIGAFVGQAAPGKMDINAIRYGGGGARQPSGYLASGPTDSTGSSEVTGPISHVSPPYFLALVATSDTSVAWYFSHGGRVWMRLAAARNGSMTIGSAGVLITAGLDNTNGMAAVFDYIRIWNSAKTFVSTP